MLRIFCTLYSLDSTLSITQESMKRSSKNSHYLKCSGCGEKSYLHLINERYFLSSPSLPSSVSLRSDLRAEPGEEAASGSSERPGGDRVSAPRGPPTAVHLDQGQGAALQQLTVPPTERTLNSTTTHGTAHRTHVTTLRTHTKRYNNSQNAQ